MTKLFVGIDWGSKTHSVCVLDAAGVVVLETEVAHRGDDVLAFVERLLGLAEASQIAAAMEAPHGVMIESLLERGIAAYCINPKQLDRFRDRHSGAGAKDDDLDAFVLAASLRTDTRLFREVQLLTEERLELGAWSRSYEALTDHVLSSANQVREHLRRYYPQMLELGDWHDEPWLWELFAAAPLPTHAASLQQATVKRILKTHRIRRYKPADVLAILRQTPLPVARGVAEATATRVTAMLPVLRAAHQQRQQCSTKMKALFRAFQNEVALSEHGSENGAAPSDGSEEPDSPEKMHHDTVLLLSLPGIGVHNGAVMLTEAYAALQNRDYQGLRRLAGIAPVSRRTGGRSHRPHVQQRRACNHRLREAVYHWGRVASQCDPRTKEHYRALRARGHSHGRAIRGVVDRLLTVLLAVLKTGVPYDPDIRQPQSLELPLAA